MPHAAMPYLTRQLDIAWKLTRFHLEGLTTEECLWRPAERGLHVWRGSDGQWWADWPEQEGYDLGPPSIAWLTWHIGFWWTMALDHTFGEGRLARQDVSWPGSAEGVRAWLEQLHATWREKLESVPAAALDSPEQTRWPFRDRPLGDVVAWVSLELTKNAAEIGYARFLYAVAAGRQEI